MPSRCTSSARGEKRCALKEAIIASDGLFLVTPEYNNSIPGVFKNAIDWAEPAAGSETDRRAAAAERTRVAREPTPRKEALPAFVPRAKPEHPGKLPARPKPSAPVETAEKLATPKSAKVAARPKPTNETREPAVQSVHFDPDTGIKTTLMTDGTVHEEPFDPRAAASSRQGRPKTEDVTSGLHKPGKAERKN